MTWDNHVTNKSNDNKFTDSDFIGEDFIRDFTDFTERIFAPQVLLCLETILLKLVSLAVELDFFWKFCFIILEN